MSLRWVSVPLSLSVFLLSALLFKGYVMFALFYAICAVFCISGAVLTLGAGAAFGLLWGFVTVSVGSTVGAVLAVIGGRWLFREYVSKRIKRDARWAAVDRAIETEGAKMVFLLRLSPVFPYVALNYGLSVTAVSLAPYTLCSWVGMMPGTLLFVYIGFLTRESVLAATEAQANNGTKSAAEEQADVESQTLKLIFWICGIVVTIVVVCFITRFARQALQRVLDKQQQDEADSDSERKPALTNSGKGSQVRDHEGG
jgi:uncharacterized membrane protein YdjX (TVP38/TMEM64 family)